MMMGVSRNDEAANGAAEPLCENSPDWGFGSDNGAFNFVVLNVNNFRVICAF
jgi:hypothetical protein